MYFNCLVITLFSVFLLSCSPEELLWEGARENNKDKLSTALKQNVNLGSRNELGETIFHALINYPINHRHELLKMLLNHAHKTYQEDLGELKKIFHQEKVLGRVPNLN